MPSRKPRLFLTLPPDVREALDEYARVSGKATATVVTELVTGLIPQIKQMTEMMQALASGNLQAVQQASHRMFAEGAAEAAVQMRDLLQAVESQPPKAPAKRGRPAKGGKGE